MFKRAILLFHDGNLLPWHRSTILKNNNTPTSSICIFCHCTTPPHVGRTTHILLVYVYLSSLECVNAVPFSFAIAIFHHCTTSQSLRITPQPLLILLPLHNSTILKNRNTPTSSICIFYHCTTPPHFGITTHRILVDVYLSSL